MSVTIRNRSAGTDPVARSHRRENRFRSLFLVGGVCAVVGGCVWLMFASSVFAVTEVRVEGATPAVNERLHASVEEVLGQRRFGFLRTARNILLLSEDAVAQSLRAAFGDVAQLEVTKQYPHTLLIVAQQREPIGAWCTGETCRYFDTTGARWGSAVPSRGPLLLLVRDERGDTQWNERLFEGMMTAVTLLPGMGLRPITITFPDAAPGDMRISVAAGYEVVADALGDCADQMATLAVLVSDKAADTSFKPQYIDVRTPGRVYYK